MGRKERGRTQEKDSERQKEKSIAKRMERIRKGTERALEQKDGRSIDR